MNSKFVVVNTEKKAKLNGNKYKKRSVEQKKIPSRKNMRSILIVNNAICFWYWTMNNVLRNYQFFSFVHSLPFNSTAYRKISRKKSTIHSDLAIWDDAINSDKTVFFFMRSYKSRNLPNRLMQSLNVIQRVFTNKCINHLHHTAKLFQYDEQCNCGSGSTYHYVLYLRETIHADFFFEFFALYRL